MATNIAALNTVYNHFMTTYAPEGTNSKYDTHKKSELRGVYNSIVKMNKDAPLFLLDSSPKTQEFAVSLKESARSLKNVISSLLLMTMENFYRKRLYLHRTKALSPHRSLVIRKRRMTSLLLK